MRFTASEKARNPNPDFIGRIVERFLIIIQKRIKVLAQLACNNIFAQLLLNTSFVVLRDLDHAVDVTVDVCFIDIL